jgi:voltage-gated potassium channel Kch
MLLKDMEIPCLYGDATDPEVWESLGDLSELKIVASTISDVEQSLTILRYLKSKWPHLIIILSADHIDEAKRLYEEGADYVICPYVIAGQMIEKGDLNDIFNEIKVADLRDEAKNHIDEMAARWRIKACQCGNKQKKTNAK